MGYCRDARARHRRRPYPTTDICRRHGFILESQMQADFTTSHSEKQMRDRLNAGEALRPKQYLKSANGYHELIMQEDNNLVLYSLGKPVWATFTVGTQANLLILQTDGNLVLAYEQGARPIQASETRGQVPAFLILQDDRNLVLYNSAGSPVWNSGTSTPLELWERRQFEASPQLMQAVRMDAALAPIAAVGIECATTGPGVVVCVGAMVAIAAIFEFANGKPPFGPGNDLRVIGGNISETAKVAGRDISREVSNFGEGLGGGLEKVRRGLGKVFGW